MGVDLKKFVDPVKKEVELKNLNGKTIAIDAFNTIYQFLATIRQPDGTPLMNKEGKITSHLSGLFYRTINLIENGIKPVYVFDGRHPEFKKREQERREEIKKKYEEKLKEAKEKGEKDLKKYAQATSKLNNEMIEDAKELLKAMGIPVIQAPSEGEAEAAYLNKKGKVDFTGSQDYDSLIFGAPYLVRNLSIVGKRKIPGKNTYEEVKPEIIERKKLLDSLKIDEDQLIALALLIGTDYNPGGIKGIGPSKALELVKQFNHDFDKLFKFVKWNNYFEYDWQEIFNFFKNPPVVDYDIKFGKIDENKIIEILVEKNDFNKERVEKYIKILKEHWNKKQTNIFSFLKK
ncbi:MAG: flap endonuclease-1 [Nanoarchaeota archaeon]